MRCIARRCAVMDHRSLHRSGFVLPWKWAALIPMLPILIFAHSASSPIRSTGAPGDQSCSRCHGGAPPGNGVTLTYSGGTRYTPGERGRFAVTINDTNGRIAYGFQASARLESNIVNGQAGELIAGTGTQVVCGDQSNAPCAGSNVLQFITQTSSVSSTRFEFDWIPPASNAGPIRVYVAAVAADGNGNESGDRVHLTNLQITPAIGSGNRPSVRQGGIVDPWTRKNRFASGMWVEIYGEYFASSVMDWSTAIRDGILPSSLNGVSVTIAGKPAAISFVSPTQVNALIPAGAGAGDVSVVVKNAVGESAPAVIRLSNISPVVFAPIPNGNRFNAYIVDNTTGALYGAAPVGSRPARPGDIAQLYALGLGPTRPPLVTDIVPPVSELENQPKIWFGQVAGEVLSAALVAPGLYQINLRVPDVDGNVPLMIEAGGEISPDNTTILVQR